MAINFSSKRTEVKEVERSISFFIAKKGENMIKRLRSLKNIEYGQLDIKNKKERKIKK